MATTTNILALLKFFASKQKSAIVDYSEFCEYLKKYSEHHLEEQPALEVYLSDLTGNLQLELDKLVERRQIILSDTIADKLAIIVIPYYIDVTAEKYSEIEVNPSIPFPVETDLPKKTPREIITQQSASDFITKKFTKEELSDKILYGLIMPHEAPAILFPSNISVKALVESSLAKVQNMLKKEEHHDYFLKKICATNPGKEMTAKNFFNGFVDRPDHAVEILSESTDNFYLWHQMCYFIKQDYEKVKDYTQEDQSVLQAIYITEIAANYFKNKAVVNAKRDSALRTLESLLSKPPYYYTYDDVVKFNDSNGIPLLGQYSEEELKNYLHDKTTGGDAHELPELLVFKVASEDKRYFIFKNKILQLILRLCTDARVSVRDALSKHWSATLRAFDSLPEMHDQAAFENRLEREVAIQSPILYALLTSSFLPLLSYENSSDEKVTLFSGGQLLPYSELLLMNRQELITDAKIMLPFWYTIPFFSWVARLILHPPKSKRNKHIKSDAELYREEELAKGQEDANAAMIVSKNSKVARKLGLRTAAREIEGRFVPETSTLDRELESYKLLWNKILVPDLSNNLTEDVNSLIRDYVRHTLRTMKPSGFTPERIQSLAETMVKMPGMQKIGEHDALMMYTKLYIIKLVKNIPL